MYNSLRNELKYLKYEKFCITNLNVSSVEKLLDFYEHFKCPTDIYLGVVYRYNPLSDICKHSDTRRFPCEATGHLLLQCCIDFPHCTNSALFLGWDPLDHDSKLRMVGLGVCIFLCHLDRKRSSLSPVCWICFCILPGVACFHNHTCFAVRLKV